MRIFLSGPMGSGKSSAAPKLAVSLGVPAFDLDELVEREAGRKVSEVFAELGEARFRSMERDVLSRQLEGDADFVLALGGGTVIDGATRSRLLEQGLVVTLRASLPELVRRVGTGEGRPLLAGDSGVEARLREMMSGRAAAYAECHLSWDTEGGGDLSAAVRGCLASPPIVVALGERTYVVRVGSGWLEQIPLPPGTSSVLVVSDTNVQPLWAQALARRWSDGGLQVNTVVIPAGEEHKTLAQIERIWDAALSARLDRDAVIVGVGGGVVTDMAAFAGSTVLRGVRVVLAPTSVLAMVDAGVGGKTGFDRPQGKNLVGSFWQPVGVFADVSTLATLPASERVGGLAEVVKSAWLDSEAAVCELEDAGEALASGDSQAMERAVRRSVRLKARVVSADERESGSRALLNLGHTLGHAFEAAAGFGNLGHGPAVGLGMLAACHVERRLAGADGTPAARLEAMLSGLGLPTDWPSHLSQRALQYVRMDKKRGPGGLRFVFPGSPGRARVESISVAELFRALDVPPQD